MPKTKLDSVDAYIAAQPEAVQGVLRQVRAAIRKAVPACAEVISYQIPTYELHDEAVLFFAGWKKHYSVYPATKGLLAALAADLEPYEIVKATIRFPLTEPVPVKLIARLAKYRAKEVTERRKARGAEPPKRKR